MSDDSDDSFTEAAALTLGRFCRFISLLSPFSSLSVCFYVSTSFHTGCAAVSVLSLSFCACFMTVSPPWRLYSCCPVFEAPITLCTPHHSWPWDDKHFHHFSPTNFYCDIWTHQSPSRPAFTGLFVSIPSHHTSPYKPFCLPSMRPFLHAWVSDEDHRRSALSVFLGKHWHPCCSNRWVIGWVLKKGTHNLSCLKMTQSWGKMLSVVSKVLMLSVRFKMWNFSSVGPDCFLSEGGRRNWSHVRITPVVGQLFSSSFRFLSFFLFFSLAVWSDCYFAYL